MIINTSELLLSNDFVIYSCQFSAFSMNLVKLNFVTRPESIQISHIKVYVPLALHAFASIIRERSQRRVKIIQPIPRMKSDIVGEPAYPKTSYNLMRRSRETKGLFANLIETWE